MTRTTPGAGTPSPNFRTAPAGGHLASTYDLTCISPAYMVGLQWNRVLRMEPSDPEADTLPLDHRYSSECSSRLK
ncbi:hypothetical protein AVEN_256561-1 [Araneus ventricosus]|uniref:Uncharacterized protein n=1 Tax=Araneus ventricosus TaxID=182803 RepID=A0A4Y2J1F2_ARAVE|nr:hypothetical protein AVEN_256561-1 [Araneus ventricosus]